MYKNFGKKTKRKKQLAQTLTMLSVVFGSLTPVGGVTWAVVVRFIEPAFVYEQRNTSVFKNKKSLEPKALKGASQLKGTLMRVFCQSRDLICIFTSSPFFILPKTQGTLRHVMALSDLHGWKVISTSAAFNNFTIILQKLFCYWNIENKLVIYNDFPKCCWVPWFNICKALYFFIKFESEVSRVWCRLCTLYLKKLWFKLHFSFKKDSDFSYMLSIFALEHKKSCFLPVLRLSVLLLSAFLLLKN